MKNQSTLTALTLVNLGFVIFLLLYLVFHSVAEALVLIFPTIYAMSGGQRITMKAVSRA